MAPQVPTYQPRVEESALPRVSVPTDAPPSAFNLGQSRNQLDAAETGLVDKGIALAADYRQKVSDVQLQDLKAKTTMASNDLKFGEDGAFKKKQLDAAGVTQDYGDRYKKQVADIANSIPDEYTRSRYQAVANEIGADLHTDLEKHTYQEQQTYNVNALGASVMAYQQDGQLNYMKPGAVEKSIEDQRIAFEAHRGTTDINIDEAMMKARSKTYEGVLTRMLTNDQDQLAAQKFQEWRPQMDQVDAQGIEHHIAEAKQLRESDQTWQGIKDYKLPDGSPDQAKMQAEIYARPDLSLEDKHKQMEYAKARAGEEHAQKLAFDQANERDFGNQVLQGKQQGADLNSALKLANQMGIDDVDRAGKAEYARKTYSPTITEDPVLTQNLWEGVQNGTVDKSQLLQSLKNDEISGATYKTLNEARYRVATSADSPEMRLVMDKIKAQADATFGTFDKANKAIYLNTVKELSLGKTPDQAWKISQDKIKEVPETSGWFSTGPRYIEADSKKIDAQRMAMGKANEDVGPAQIKGIQSGISMQLNRPAMPADIDAFAAHLGGYDQLKLGTPTNAAISSLIRAGKPVTTGNINAILAIHPDGNYTPKGAKR